MTATAINPLHSAIQKVATGPDYSKDLDFDDAYATMRYILSGEADPVQVSIFFIALRMKRESDEENRGILQALIDCDEQITIDSEHLIDLSDPYDGYIRGIPASPFLPAVLSACGYPTLTHGIETLGPKYGVTHHKILKAAGKNPLQTKQQVKAALESKAAWSYIDQSIYNPVLFDMHPLRKRIIKRQVLTTVEVLSQPFRASGRTHIATGYVHKAYPPIYASLARQAKFDSMVLIRGVEGGVVPSLKQAGRYFSYQNLGEETMTETSPADLDITQDFRNNPLPESLSDLENNRTDEAIDQLAKIAAEQGLGALSGEKGAARDSIVYSGSIILSAVSNSTLEDAAKQINDALDSKQALEKFTNHP